MARDMHTHDERLTRMVLTAMHDRLAMDPVPLDRPGDVPALTAQLDGLITAQGTEPHRVMEMWTDVLAPHVMSSDASNFLAFIPAAPTKAALLFDMLVSGASIQGISALEAAGAIAAENQVLRLIADLAGLPATAGGVFVSGGSAGNLSALTVARDIGRQRRGLGRGELTRIAVSDQAHSSISNALSILDMEALVVPTDDHVLTGPALAAALESDPSASNVVGVVATSGTTNAGIIDELSTIAEVARDRGLWFHVDGAYGGGGLFAPSVRPLYAGLEHADSFIVDPHKWMFAPYDCAALLYREPRLAKAVHTQDASYLDVIHTRRGRVEPQRSGVPPDATRPRPAAVVLPRGQRDRRLHPRRRERPGPRPLDRPAGRRQRPPDPAARTDPVCRAVRAPRMGPGRLRPVGRRAARRPGRACDLDQVGGTHGRAPRVPAPTHHPRAGRAGPGCDGLTAPDAWGRPPKGRSGGLEGVGDRARTIVAGALIGRAEHGEPKRGGGRAGVDCPILRARHGWATRSPAACARAWANVSAGCAPEIP